jgi:hypothetical protein
MKGKFVVTRMAIRQALAVEFHDAKGRKTTTTFAKSEAKAIALADELNSGTYPEGARSLWPNPFRA